MNGNIYITGFMGAGKSTVGRALADMLGRRFVDLDDLLVKRFKKPIAEVFDEQGETFFREKEKTELHALARTDSLVVGTGGGVVLDEDNRHVMTKSGTVVWLKTSLDECRKRTMSQQGLRPLWRDDKKISRLFNQRRKLYAMADLTVDTTGLNPDAVTDAIVAALFPDDCFDVVLDGDRSRVTATLNGPRVLAKEMQGRRAALLVDKTVARLHLDRYLEAFDSPEVIIVPGGERTKTLKGAEKIYQRLLDARFNRDDVFVAVGGGAITDLGAFVAATFKRGMGFILVSTSLLGVVDAAVGGKAAVNLGPTKNTVGLFTAPKAVILDSGALATLTPSGISEGLIEAYKTGLVASKQLADRVRQGLPYLLDKDRPWLLEISRLSARAKGDVVHSDFTEQGRRAILNLGHTYGHSVESCHNFKVSHGKSVALGMIVAARISATRKLISEKRAEEIIDTVRRIVPKMPEAPPMDDAWEIMQHDKKIRKGRLIFVLLKGPGRPVIVDNVGRDEIARAAKGL